MDTFQLSAAGEIIINGSPLLDLVRMVEQPFVDRELAARISAGEEPSEIHLVAGEYCYPSQRLLRLPCRNLLDEPACVAEKGFGNVRGSELGKALILECTCGQTECWFLAARIELTADHVRWHSFSQYHRNWSYELTFEFNREQYERQLEPIG